MGDWVARKRVVYRCFSEVLAAVLLDDVRQGSVVCVHAGEVAADTEDSLLHVVAGVRQAVRVPVLGGLAEVDQVSVEDAHVTVLHALSAQLDLVGVRVGLVHPLILEAVGSSVLHGLSSHVLQGFRQVHISCVVLVEGVIRGSLAIKVRFSEGVGLLLVLLLDHVLQDLGRELGISRCHFYCYLKNIRQSPFYKILY